MTDAELAILSIVAEGPIYGFDIQTVVDKRGLRAWTNIGISSMYYVLEKLERQGLLASQGAARVEGPSRRQYRITSAGIGVLQTAVADLLSSPHDALSGFELGLANLNVLRPMQLRVAFNAYQQELLSRLAQTRSRSHDLQQQNAPFNVDSIFSHQIAMLEAELAWLEEFIAQWEAQNPPEEAPADTIEPVEIPRMKQVILPHDPDSPHRAPTRPLKQTHADPPAKPASSAKDTAINHRTPPASSTPTAGNQED